MSQSFLREALFPLGNIDSPGNVTAQPVRPSHGCTFGEAGCVAGQPPPWTKVMGLLIKARSPAAEIRAYIIVISCSSERWILFPETDLWLRKEELAGSGIPESYD